MKREALNSEARTKSFGEIANVFVHRLASGLVGGLNNKIEVFNPGTLGISNLDHFFQRLFLNLEGYQVCA